MTGSGRIRKQLALAIVLTALIPLLGAITLANKAVRTTSAKFYRPDVGVQLERSLELHQELSRTLKTSMRFATTAMAADAELRKAAVEGNRQEVRKRLERQLAEYPGLVSLTVLDAKGDRLASVDRGRQLDPEKENKLEVSRFLSDAANLPDEASEEYAPEDETDDGGAEEAVEPPAAPRLVAVFAAAARQKEFEDLAEFITVYKKIEKERDEVDTGSVRAFAALLGLTILGAIGVGVLLARRVSSRLDTLAAATRRVGAGDLSIRVPEAGSDEIASLARAFNRMLDEVETSRARIEYLQRIGAWQEMARRLAHEIKNPLTPIQLAVQEVHRRYPGDDDGFRKLLDTTREIVEDEVGTLRRLVSEFSGFARLPQAKLDVADLVEFLGEQRDRISIVEDESLDDDMLAETGAVLPRGVELEFSLPQGPAEALIDRQMLRRALINLIRNAGQAIESAGSAEGHVRVSLRREGEYWWLDVDDSGPGVPLEMRQSIFDPYVTTKTEGTGLGLAIVKKIVVEHGGTVAAEASDFGGARIRIRLPAAGTPAASAVLDARWQTAPPSSRPPVTPASDDGDS